MKTILTIAGFALVAGLAVTTGAAESPGRMIEITAGDQMKFSVTRIEARPGETIHVMLSNTGTMPRQVMAHNWVLLKSGQDPVAYANAAVAAAPEEYAPKALASQVLASISMLGPKQQGETTFVAPMAPGTYYYLCSFPAHCQAGMRGELIVK